jgi:hypothetical protein
MKNSMSATPSIAAENDQISGASENFFKLGKLAADGGHRNQKRKDRDGRCNLRDQVSPQAGSERNQHHGKYDGERGGNETCDYGATTDLFIARQDFTEKRNERARNHDRGEQRKVAN